MDKQIPQTGQKNYVYIEILRQVSPDQSYEDFDWFVLGGFDGMKVELKEDILSLKKCYEIGQKTTPELFDRQPLFLYTPQDMAQMGRKDIFSKRDDYETRPLIVTLFQLDKIRLAWDDRLQTPDALIDAFTELVEEEMRLRGITEEEIEKQVFWNLGESDVVVIFRPDTLSVLAKIIHALRIGERKESNNGIRIISTSSHCAFPKLDITGETSEDVADIFQTRLRKWLDREFKAQKSEFVTLVNISDEYHNQRKNAALLFGEWDYMYRYDKSSEEELVSSLTNIFIHLVREEQGADFKASYTIPVLRDLPDVETSGKDNREKNTKTEERQWIKSLQDSMQKLHKQANRIFGEGKRNTEADDKSHGSQLLNTLTSLSCSVEGIAKFLYRLKEGRFEEDLYVYVKPVFTSLATVTDSFKKNIRQLKTTGHENEIDSYIRSYISDTADLLGKLQHLFSIMAVSPYTFMETYGSNMRSLAASDKLLNAYQGLIRFLGDKFPNCIKETQSSHAILVLPYRDARSMHMLLYGKSDPTCRISYIQIDFAKMFDLRSTVFMLLHECGHHLGERFREARLQYLTKAAICLCFEWIGGEKLIQEPIQTFLLRMNKNTTIEELEREENVLFGGLRKKSIKRKYGDGIRNATIEGIRGMSNALSLSVERSYKESLKGDIIKEEKENYFRRSVVKYLADIYIPSMFCIKSIDPISAKMKKRYDERFNKNVITVQAGIGKSFSAIAKALSDEIIADKGGNSREALRLKTVYADAEGFAKGLLESSAYLIQSKIKEGAIEMLGEMFSDIYSDVFAIRILDIGMDDYVEIIPRLLGTDLHEILKPASLFRVFTVLEVCWKNSEAKKRQSLNNLANGDGQIKDELQKKWTEFKMLSYRIHLIEYAQKCNTNMKVRVKQEEKFEKKGDFSLGQLRNMFNDNDTKGQINGVFYFCKYLMKGEADNDELKNETASQNN